MVAITGRICRLSLAFRSAPPAVLHTIAPVPLFSYKRINILRHTAAHHTAALPRGAETTVWRKNRSDHRVSFVSQRTHELLFSRAASRCTTDTSAQEGIQELCQYCHKKNYALCDSDATCPIKPSSAPTSLNTSNILSKWASSCVAI